MSSSPPPFPHASPLSSSACAFREEVCAFGDSITQHGHMAAAHGWVCGLQEAYRRRADVLNRGYSGYSSRFARAMLPRIFGAERRYLFTTVFFGANDAADAASKPAQHVPLEEYEENMAVIVEAARAVRVGSGGGASGACGGAERMQAQVILPSPYPSPTPTHPPRPQVSRCVLVIGPPPVCEVRWDNRSLARARAYGDAAKRVALAAGAAAGAGAPAAPILFLSAFDLLVDAPAHGSVVEEGRPLPPAGPVAPGAPHWHAFLSDGLHLSPAGNDLLSRAVLAAIAAGCPSIAPSALTIDFPVWSDVPPPPHYSAAAFGDEALATLHAEARAIP